MRIGVNTLFLLPRKVGGSETYLRKLLQALTEGWPGDTFVLFTNAEGEPVLRNDLKGRPNVTFASMGFSATNRPLRVLREQFLLPFHARRHAVDVLWSPNYTACCCAPCPQVVTVHDVQYRRHPEDLRLVPRLALDVLVRMACARCTAILAVSEFAKSEVLRFTEANADRVHVTYEGVDPVFGERLPEAELRERVQRHMPAAAPFILCVANVHPHKHVELLVDAFALIADALPHHLVLVGQPHKGEPLVRASLKRLGRRAERVHRFAALTGRDVLALYQAAALFVLPSVYEGFGLPVLEAMSAGVPVITTRSAAIPEVGGEFVQYVYPVTAESLADEIRRVTEWGEEALRKRIAAAARRAARFTWAETAVRTHAVLAAAAARQPVITPR